MLNSLKDKQGFLCLLLETANMRVPLSESDTPMVSPMAMPDSPVASPTATPTVSPWDNGRYFEQALSLLRDQLSHERARSDRLEARIVSAEADLKASQEATRRAETALDRYYAAGGRAAGQGAVAAAPGGMEGRIGRRRPRPPMISGVLSRRRAPG